MFTQPQISTNENITTRSFIYFYHDSQRYKYYNGNKLNLSIFPNQAKIVKERNALLKQLQFEYYKALSNGWKPTDVDEEKKCIQLVIAFRRYYQKNFLLHKLKPTKGI